MISINHDVNRIAKRSELLRYILTWKGEKERESQTDPIESWVVDTTRDMRGRGRRAKSNAKL